MQGHNAMSGLINNADAAKVFLKELSKNLSDFNNLLYNEDSIKQVNKDEVQEMLDLYQLLDESGIFNHGH